VSPQPYVGVPTFLRGDLRPLDGDWHAMLGVLGIPFDGAGGFRSGARWAPRALREASLRYAPPPDGFVDLETGRTLLAGTTVADTGDVELPSLEDALVRERIEAAARALRERCRLPLFLGGDHSVSYPLLRSFDDVASLHVVQIDAHLDFSDVRDGTRWSNSSPFRRAAEALPELGPITVVGLRGLRTDPEALAAARARGHQLIPAWEVARVGVQRLTERLPEGQEVYLSIDVDALDPSILSATSSPEVEGLGYAQARDVIRAVAQRNRVLGIDVVELAPGLDTSGLSSLVAARLAVEAVAEALA
jgi:agmatinase